ncbi:MAG: rod shape-determining protein MreD [Kiritimatiellae bacterium]|jgi:rod shape-determining protein MreD|nr:rod shape-determining protein MreD [Kiritimatiellia bacterium]MDD4341682.1 rod shape-determining protein MreD [Kiritimatiellia bacterium]MDY0148666.1 rod shape-determining protein MreD [Kiritimatiellia bacterium]
MTMLSLLFWLIVGGMLQVLIPAWHHMGQPSFPFVLGVVLFAALTKKSRYFVTMALLGGVLVDSLSLAPLGFSTCAFLVAGGLAVLLRKHFFSYKATTISVVGALCAAVSTAAMATLLRMKGLVGLSLSAMGWRMAGSAVLGAILIPVLFGLMRGLERRLGVGEDA